MSTMVKRVAQALQRDAMGLPGHYKLQHGTRRDRIMLLGNSVAPPVMKAVVEALVRA
jgi:site-specific DNA-cytosine methylase